MSGVARMGAALALVCFGGAVSACGGAASMPCGDGVFRKWQRSAVGADARREAAQAVVRCELLEGATKSEVRRALGRPERLEEQHPSEFEREWYYLVGETNTEFGPGDEQNLVIKFDRRGEVRSASVSPP